MVDGILAMSPPTVLAGLPLGVLQGARSLGLDADALLSGAGLRWEDLADPDARVLEDRFLAVLDALERQKQVADFGLQLSRMFRLEMLGAVGYAIGASADLEDALRTLIRFARLVHEQTMYRLELGPDGLWFGRALDPRYGRMLHSTSHSLGGILTLATTLTGRADVTPLRVQLQHPRPPNAEQYDAFFGLGVEFGSEVTAITLPRWSASLPVVRHDPSLFAYLSRHAEGLLARLPPQGASTATRVRALVTENLRSGNPNQDLVARRLGIGQRTLQRRLKDEGTTFADVVDDVRRELATLYLAEPRLAVYEVALLLGYSEPSAFFRAFRRWTGRTPHDYRNGGA